MVAGDVLRGTMWEGEAPPPIVLRLAAEDGTALKLVDANYGIDQVDLRVYDAYDPLETVLVTKTLTRSGGQLAGIMFDTLQTDGYAFDSVGYNFRHQLTAAETTGMLGGRTYVFEYKFTPTNVAVVAVQVRVAWVAVISSVF